MDVEEDIFVMDTITASLVPEAVPGESQGRTAVFPLRGKLINIGRGAQNDVVLESLQISRRHAELKYDNGKWSIRDVSTNGITLNSRRLQAHIFYPLKHQDLIQFIPTPAGQLVYRFLYNNHEEVIVEEDEENDNESLLSVKSPAEPVIIDEKKTQKRKLQFSGPPPTHKRRPEVIHLSDDEDFTTPSENDKPLSSFTESELLEEVKLLRGRLARSLEQHKKNIEGLLREKSRLEGELEVAREEVQEFGGRINGLLESELSCSVCSEVFVDARVTSCGHTFCAYCIREWLRKKGDCPICRKHVRGSSRHVEIDNFVDKAHILLPADAQSRRTAFLAERKVQEQQHPVPPPQVVGFVGQLHAINQFIMAGNPPPAARRSSRRSRREQMAAAAAMAAAASSSAHAQNVQPGVIDLSRNQ